MEGFTEKSPLERIADTLIRHGVEFCVVGGQAEALHGSARVTYDVDLCYRRTADNLDRLAAALAELHPQLRGAPLGLPFNVDAKSLALGCNFTLITDLGPLDLLGYMEPVGTYEDVIEHAESTTINANRVAVLSLDDLIRIKQHIQRPKDRDSLMHLLAIQRVRREQP
jgi:predicted nucleotidyltransferase